MLVHDKMHIRGVGSPDIPAVQRPSRKCQMFCDRRHCSVFAALNPLTRASSVSAWRTHSPTWPRGATSKLVCGAYINLPVFSWPFGRSAEQQARRAAVKKLLDSLKDLQRGLKGSKEQQADVLEAVEALAQLGASTQTAGPALNATWRLLWTTEKETLFILSNASKLGTQAGDVFQVIDLEASRLQNVITFPPEGAFIVDSRIEVTSISIEHEVTGDQRVTFQFTGATLKLPKRAIQLPPFGKGWFDTVYVDEDIRVARDVRGDTLVVMRDGPPRIFE